MNNTPAKGPIRKRIAVLSDSDLLFNVIKVNLKQSDLAVEYFTPYLLFQSKSSDIDLIIIASSSPLGEPLITLLETVLANHVGCTPILIISDRSFYPPWLNGQIWHLDFPFDAAMLRYQARQLLAGQPPATNTPSNETRP